MKAEVWTFPDMSGLVDQSGPSVWNRGTGAAVDQLPGRSAFFLFTLMFLFFFILALVATMSANQRSVILFDERGGPEFSAQTIGYKNFIERLKRNWQMKSYKAQVTYERIAQANIYIIANANRQFTKEEIEALDQFMNNGKNLLLLSSGGDASDDSQISINQLAEHYGIIINNDSVIRNQFYKYFHPKEAYISDGVVNKIVTTAAGVVTSDNEHIRKQLLKIVYPYGSTLTVQENIATPLLSSGFICYPQNRPICAIFHSKSSNGKVIVLGSQQIFSDSYLDKEDNSKLLTALLNILSSEELSLEKSSVEDAEISPYHYVPDHLALSKQLKCCFQEAEANIAVKSINKLFESSLYSITSSLWTRILKAYAQLEVKHEPLTLIVFPAIFRVPGPPDLELFDLQEEFSTERDRLVQASQKYSEDQLENFINDCAECLGIVKHLPAENRTAKHVLQKVKLIKHWHQETTTIFTVIYNLGANFPAV
ncbi:Intraflagellar transport protein 52 -like protein [Trichinella papuae]|uniref:Intraflagellar transport protein 52-like protein n=1 Tax=Trichinella papuae TaxID=268474 RepID=A0A0V1MEA1_9BILA|nr:Intraflagellar transport protein 52 -like protein [Trichinella papuae]